MSFWCYILHCRGGVFYTGHTDDLERRMLAWPQDFATRYETLDAERRVKAGRGRGSLR